MRKPLLFPHCRNLLLCVGVLAAVGSLGAAEPPQGFRALFNGKDLSGWHGMPEFDPYKLQAMPAEERAKQVAAWTADAKKHWRVENGELVGDGGSPFATTDQEFGDIELLVEFRTKPKADGFIYMRSCRCVQAFDRKTFGGGRSDNDPPVPADAPLGEWHRYRVVQVGERTTVYVDDKLAKENVRAINHWNRALPLPKKGPIQLSTHGGEVRWRNIFVRVIPPAEANEILRRGDASGFVSVFNGRDFTGWGGPIENYEVKDGAIVCKPKKGGNIFTQEEYGDFVARLEYKLPPGGNNGLAIRYPGKGQPSVDAMCEIQILDDDASKYANLDKRQYNGSSYGMIPAHRGYLRPVGEWNFMEVTLRGSTLQVELNGTRILDGDLSKITEFMNNKIHPGKDRTSGHFGFCGHNDPVAFRNIEIKRLEAK